ncbi:MAG: alkaline phosphatase D family protein [Woeseiaceae bacterium]
MLRRNFVRATLGGGLLALTGLLARITGAAGRISFEHGVASGDPLADRVILWTRVSGADGRSIKVRWQVAIDERMTSVISHGVARTSSASDYTVKVDAGLLPAGSTLYYRFEAGGVHSPIGRTRTLPTGGVAQVRMAVVTCAAHSAGFFHVYREIAHRDDIDVVIHLGDYIYEYGHGEYASEHAEELGRIPEPRNEIVTLGDYRMRHAQYKSDSDAQAMHQAHAMIAIWDDHEVANDAWKNGAKNHQDDEGRWARRRGAAMRAYFEWMPIRNVAKSGRPRIFRSFRFGDLMTLIMLDTRFYGRDLQPDAGGNIERADIEAARQDPRRRMLGRRQERWLRRTLKQAAGTTWQVIGQQVMVVPLKSPDLEPLLDLDGPSLLSREFLEGIIEGSKDNPSMMMDTWDGYLAAKQDFLMDLDRYATNPVVLSGDLHTSIGGDLIPAGQEYPVAVEFMPSSITSPVFAEYLPERYPCAVRDATMRLNPSLKYMETDRRGWVCVTVTKSECRGEWHLLDGVRERTYSSAVDCSLTVRAGAISEGLQKS